MDDAPAIYNLPPVKSPCGAGLAGFWRKYSARSPYAIAVALGIFTAALPARAQTQTSGADASAWALIHDTSDAQILDLFIAAYPASPLAALAQARKRELSARASTGHAVQSNPPAATGETFMDGGRKGVAATPGTTILRVRPAKPAQEALRLSPERLSNWNNQLSSGGSNSYSGYFPAPRVVGVKPVPGNALPAAFNGNINLTLFRL